MTPQPEPTIPASFATDPTVTTVGPGGQLAHREHLANTARFEPRLERPAPSVWTVVGHGLSNQTFVEGPDGLIAIDTGECVEEMAAALALVREDTDKPIVAVIYSHFHYVFGTSALGAEGPIDDVEIWGHAGIADNLARSTAEIGPAYGRGIVEQFGLALPADGPDSVANVGLGNAFRNPGHAPFTPGHAPATRTFTAETRATIGGLDTVLTPAPSDADDSITIWFPELGLCVQNLVWPALFNVFAIRGETYRDPRVVVEGVDHLLSLRPATMVGTHGPPLVGTDHIRAEVTRYRDAIQFLWDQTVRAVNEGLTADEVAERVQLPSAYDASPLTRQLYGLVEHHVRQIRTGLVGWFDGDEGHLFPLPRAERCRRLIDGFGGRAEVRRRAAEALAADDLRWALELAGWLVRSDVDERGRADGGSEEERSLLAGVLRAIGQRTTSANVRNWCLTRAVTLEGGVDLGRYRFHRLGPAAFDDGARGALAVLRVLLDPARAAELDRHVGFVVDGVPRGLHVRRGVAVPTEGGGADVVLRADGETFADILVGRSTIDAAVTAGRAEVTGDADRLAEALDCFDRHALRSPRWTPV